LAVRRLFPLTVLVVVVLASVAGAVAGVVTDPLLAIAFALYPVALVLPDLRPDPTRWMAGGVGALLVFGMVGGAAGDTHATDSMRWPIAAVIAVGGAWALGRTVRERRLETARAMREEAERLVTEERLRIARELHDVVSSSLSIIGVRASVAGYLVDRDGWDHDREQVREALAVIERASSAGLADMRQMLDIMRGERSACCAALPGRLVAHTEHAALAGVMATLRVTDLPPLTPEQELVVERVVQESLANVIRHAGATTAQVVVQGGGGRVEVMVDDDGAVAPPGWSPGDGGHGLVGMRERVSAMGGILQAGPRDLGGWRVWVCFPAAAAVAGR
jgi:signal transduction histidine kinase